jgi:outer membrane protein insertion porin family
VVVDVDVEEQPTGSISFGASYSSVSGFGGTFAFSERNFLGRGQTFSINVSAAESTQSYAMTFVEPAMFGRDLAFGVGLSYAETDSLGSDFDTTNGVLRPFLSFPVSDNGRLQVRYTAAVTDITGSGAIPGGVVATEALEGQRTDSSFGYTYSFDTARGGLSPVSRYLFEFSQDFGGAGGDTTFIRTGIKAVAQTRVMSEEVTLRATFEGGALSYSRGNSRVTDRFQISPNLMRGFEYGGIGPREISATGDDDPLGGNFFAVARFEAEFPIGLPEEYGVSGGVFYDIGSVWGVNDNATAAAGGQIVSQDFETRQVVGVSVFWDSVLGPLRLDFTEPLQKNSNDKTRNFNLSVSTEF